MEEVKLIDDFTNKKTGRTSNCFRIAYRSNERCALKPKPSFTTALNTTLPLYAPAWMTCACAFLAAHSGG